MAKLPPESLPKRQRGNDVFIIKENIKVYFIYWITAVLAIELFSVVVQDSPKYLLFWYPLLTQIQVLILLVAFITHGKVLRFCESKMVALWAFTLYYGFGILAILFQLSGQLYNITTNVILLTVFWVFIYNLIKNKE